VGVLFTLWSGFSQFKALTHGTKVVTGAYDDKDDPGAINHFQALSAALSATVGLGNIAGVGLAVALGGPGAVFWMWMVGLFGMAIKTTEVCLSMLYRNTDDPDNPHGGPMFVAAKGLKERGFGGAGQVHRRHLRRHAARLDDHGRQHVPGVVGRRDHRQLLRDPVDRRGHRARGRGGMVIIGGIKRIGAVAGGSCPRCAGCTSPRRSSCS
jgi:AGCS family alanine or glycine:cation symporter